MTPLPGWKTAIDEISNGIFKVTLTDNFGRKVEVVDVATDETIQKAYEDAFEIEKQVSLNWNKFLYDLCLTQLSKTITTAQNFNAENFGSWVIEINYKRFVYIVKNKWLITQTKKDNKWFDQEIYTKEDLAYQQLSIIIKKMQV